jgi:type I site-specific restriction-modification system R (restriction) subunit
MQSHAYTEDQLVEQPAIGLFAELGWTTVSALEESFGATGTLQRETKGDVVLGSRLRTALERLNRALPAEAITAAVDELRCVFASEGRHQGVRAGSRARRAEDRAFARDGLGASGEQ